MRMVSRHSGIEVIDSDECRRLLAEDVIGRVAVVIGATPMILPVNYAVDGEDIVMRTMPGSRLDIGQGHAAFEVDSFDRATQSGWSVLVTGHLEEVTLVPRQGHGAAAGVAGPAVGHGRPQSVAAAPSRVRHRPHRPHEQTESWSKVVTAPPMTDLRRTPGRRPSRAGAADRARPTRTVCVRVPRVAVTGDDTAPILRPAPVSQRGRSRLASPPWTTTTARRSWHWPTTS